MRYLSFVVLVSLALVVTACGGDDDDTFFAEGRLLNTPPGGTDFGLLRHFDIATHTAVIINLDDADGYDFSLLDDSLVIISVESLDQLNPFVELFDANGFFITGDDDGGVGTDALIVDSLRSGNYTIVVWSSLDGPVVGDYELNVIIGSPGADLGIFDIGVTTIQHDIAIAAGADAQSYVLTLSAPSHVDFEVLQRTGNADLAMQLINQRGDEVFFFDPAGLGDPVVLDEPLDRGTYLLIVSNEVTAGSGVYDLTVAVLP